jgi:hypothetical protein
LLKPIDKPNLADALVANSVAARGEPVPYHNQKNMHSWQDSHHNSSGPFGDGSVRGKKQPLNPGLSSLLKGFMFHA